MKSVKYSPKQEQLIAALKKSGLRVTEARLAILQVLAKHHGPYSAEDIHKGALDASCDLATIYRTLGSLEKVGVVLRCEFGDGTARYELSERSHHHHHVICRKCKKIEVLDDCELENLEQFAVKKGFRNVTHNLEFFGICPQCSGETP